MITILEDNPLHQIQGLRLSDSLWAMLEKEYHRGKNQTVRLVYLILYRLFNGYDRPERCSYRPIYRRKFVGMRQSYYSTSMVPDFQDVEPRTLHTRLLNLNRIGDYFTFREKEGMISYMPKGRTQQFNADGSWKREGRISLKPAKWLKSMLSPRLAKRIKDHHFAAFDAVVKAEEASMKMEFREVSFEEAYDCRNYERKHSYDPGVPDSCMWGKDVGPFYRLLGAKALVAIDQDGRYRGRAVFWPKVHTKLPSDKVEWVPKASAIYCPGGNVPVLGGTLQVPEGVFWINDLRAKKIKEDAVIPFMDRVYADSPFITELFLQYAQDQGWYRKLRQSREDKEEVVFPDGTEGTLNMHVIAARDLSNISFYPYMDTFAGGDDDDRTLSNSESGTYVYVDTDGTREGDKDEHEGEVQDVDGEWIDEDDAVEVDGDWYSFDDSRIARCHRSENYHLRSDMYEVALSRHETILIHSDYVTPLD